MDDFPDLTSEEEALYNMSDEELEAAFADAKAELGNDVEDTPDTDETGTEEDESASEDEEEELEQPDAEDSNDVEDEVVIEQEEEEQSDEPDESESDDVVPEPEAVITEPTKNTYRANGQDYEFTDDEVKEQFGKVFGQAANYTQKMQEIAPWRKTISALKENEIGHEDVNLMIDALKGNQEAAAEMLKKAGVDILSLDTEEETKYTPREYGLSETALAIQDIESRISGDQEYNITTHVVNKQWDEKSRDVMFKEPELIEGLHYDIKAGIFDEISPIATKLKVLDGGSKSDLDYYAEAAQTWKAGKETKEAEDKARIESEKQAKEQAKQVQKAKESAAKQERVKAQSKARKAAVPTKKAAGKTVIDYLDDSEEAYDDWYKKLQASL